MDSTDLLKLDDKNGVLHTSFNQTHSLFTVGTEHGFYVYNSNPFKEMKYIKMEGGIGIAEMLYQTNIFALVGGGKNPQFPPNKVIIWDDHIQKPIGEMTFRSRIRNVKLKRDKVIVSTDNKIHIYNFADLKLIDQFETNNNYNGLCAINANPEKSVFVCPSLKKGSVTTTFYDTNKTNMIQAHESDLAYIATNYDGTLIATASIKGTLIRVFDSTAEKEKKIFEFRRGMDETAIRSMCFDAKSKWLAVSSEKGTIHVYSLINNTENQQSVNTFSGLSVIGGFIPYFSSEWSYKQFKIPELLKMGSSVGFSDEKTLVVISENGNYYKINFTENEPKVESKKLLLSA